MPKRIIPLTDLQVSKAKPKTKEIKLFDGGGLFLLITPSGGKLWYCKYRYDSKERKLSFGSYPEISLSDARRKREEARKLLANDIDPGEVRKAQKALKEEQAANSFEVIAREWHGKQVKEWSAGHSATILDRLEKNIFPWIGSRPITDIKPPEMLAVLRRIESRGALDSAHRLRYHCGKIFRYAIATGRAERDPAADLKDALPPVRNKHYSAPTDPKDVAPLLRAIDGFEGSYIVKCAMEPNICRNALAIYSSLS